MAAQARIDADLRFEVAESGPGGDGRPAISGSVRASGTHIDVRADDPAMLSAESSSAHARSFAASLARRGLTMSIGGPDGPMVVLGAVRRSWLQRPFTHSPHIRVANLRALRPLLRRRRERATGSRSVATFLPPATLLPLAPTLGRPRRRVTTTHDPRGGGQPRLFFALGPWTQAGDRARVFYLLPELTTIGSADDADLQIDGLDPLHAEIRRTEDDEYVVVSRTERADIAVNGAPVREGRLRTGTRLEIASSRFAYFREEYADHGRPFGGRQGGEIGHQRAQPSPRPRGTTGEGRPRTDTDRGEYY